MNFIPFIIIIPLPALRQVHRLFQSEFSTECYIVLPLSIYNILSFPRLYYSCLRLLLCLPITYMFFSSFPSIVCSIRQFLAKMWPNQLAFLYFAVCRIFISSFNLRNDRFPHYRSNWSSPSFSSATFQNFPGICDLFSYVSKLQHYKMLCSKRSTSLFSSLSLSPICLWQSLIPVECCFCYSNLVSNFTCTSCIFCYYSTQVVEIFHISRFLIGYNICWDGCFEIIITLLFPHLFLLHNIFQFLFVYQLCPIALFILSYGKKPLQERYGYG